MSTILLINKLLYTNLIIHIHYDNIIECLKWKYTNTNFKHQNCDIFINSSVQNLK